MRSVLVVILLSAGVVGCLQPSADPVEDQAEAALLTTTTVRLLDDGGSEVSVLSETQAERTARLGGGAQRHAGDPVALAGATSAEACTDATYSDLYLCDTANQYCSGGNVACIYGYGSIALKNVPRGAGNWNGAVRQFEPDAWSGQFLATRGAACNQSFGSGYTIVDPAGSCAQRADTVKLCKLNGSLCAGARPGECCSGRCGCGGNPPLLCSCY